MKGQIVKIIAGFYDIECDNKIYRVRGSGTLRHQKIIPVVGDYVEFSPHQFLQKIHPRQNFLVRPRVANIDQAIIVMSLQNPQFSSFLLDKILTIFNAQNIKSIIVFTKIDLVNNNIYKEIYQKQGYKIFEINNINFESSALSNIFTNKISVFVGQSGVGKSSTINSIAKMNLPIQPVSNALKRGKHTTRVVEMVDFASGKMIDTPGFSSINFDLTKLQVAKFFDNFRQLIKDCEFNKNCLHVHEKNCAIKKAVNKKIILENSYQNYLKLIEEAK